MAKKDFKGIPTYAFADLTPVTLDEVSYKGHATGLRFPDGSIMAFPKSGTHFAASRTLARTLGAELIVIHGTWTFSAEIEVNDDDD